MKLKFFLLIVLCCFYGKGKAQFFASASPAVSYNASSFFKGFKEEYNNVNKKDLKKNLGSPSLGLGYSIKISYKIMGLFTNVGRDNFSASTRSEFTNSSQRIVQYHYKFTTANIGYYHSGNRKDFSIEVGMIHGIVSQYSFVKFANGQKDYFAGGISANQTWINLGLNLQLNFYKPLNDHLMFNYGIQGAFLNNSKDIAPRIKYSNNTAATLTFNGVILNAGLTLKIGKEID